MSFFNFGRTFYLDASTVQGASTAGISSVDLAFMYRPDRSNNISGINLPGITLYITETIFDMPRVTSNTFLQVARAEWNNIRTSSDGTAFTKFVFNTPIQLETNKLYAFLISYDGNEQFMPWHNRKGYPLASGGISPGPSSQIIGQYYEFVNSGTLDQLEAAIAKSDYQAYWNPVTNLDLKFRVNVARYATNSYPVFANSSISPTTAIGQSALMVEWNEDLQKMMLLFPSSRMECISFDRAKSVKQAFVGAQRAYQNTVFYPGGKTTETISTNMSNTITANGQMSNGATFSWYDIYEPIAHISSSTEPDRYIVLFNGEEVNIRKVISVVSNTQIVVDEPVTFANSAAKFMVAPVAKVDAFDSINGTNTSLMFLKSSSANSSVRFTSDSIDISNVAISNGGSGYSNSDVLYIRGFEYVANKVPAKPTNNVGNHWAIANITTNSTGGIVNLHFSNVGAGFVNSSALQYIVTSASNTNPTSNNSAGNNAVIVAGVGSTICTELTQNIFRNCKVINFDVQYINPHFSSNIPEEVSYDMYLRTMYTVQADANVAAGQVAYVVPSSTNTTIPISVGGINRFTNTANPPCLVSRSNEFVTLYANGVQNDRVNALVPYSNAYVVEISLTTNNDFVSPHIESVPFIEFAKYIINNDYTNEHTNYGNAYSKHISSIVSFSAANNQVRLSEDLRVFITAYRPSNTNFQCYARVKNSSDTEAFDDEDWSRLDLIDGIDVYSSSTNQSDYVELTYGFVDCPNTDITLTGTVTTTNASAIVTGVGTTFDSDLAVNDLVKLYDPLFANSNYAVACVQSVTNSTSVIIDQLISSNTAVGIGGQALAGVSGLKVDRIRNYKHQAFNNIQNENIVRYYNANNQIFNGYDSLQLKFVFLSAQANHIPRIHNIRGSGLSA